MKLPTIPNRINAIKGWTIATPKLGAWHTRGSDHAHWSAAIRKRAGYVCERCGRHNVRMFADHIKEVADGGERYDLSNGQCLCGACHSIKTNNERMKRAAQSYRQSNGA